MNPHRCSLFVPGTGARRQAQPLTFGRPPRRRFWRGCAAHLAGGEALSPGWLPTVRAPGREVNWKHDKRAWSFRFAIWQEPLVRNQPCPSDSALQSRGASEDCESVGVRELRLLAPNRVRSSPRAGGLIDASLAPGILFFE